VSAQTADNFGPLFIELRRCLRLPLPEIARRLETRMDVVEALERGDVRCLPPWPETVRVVSAYTLLAKIDPRPVLHVIGARISADAPLPASTAATTHSARTDGRAGARRTSLPQAGKSARDSGAGRLLAGGFMPELGRPALRWMAAAAVALMLLSTLLPSQMLQASAVGSGDSVWGGLAKYMRFTSSKVKDGYRWIEVDDPRSRKGDKLRSDKP
jgi:hypothetical protein